MTVPERVRLLAFGLFTWSLSMFTAVSQPHPLTATCAPVMAGIGVALFITALLPGRTARFS